MHAIDAAARGLVRLRQGRLEGGTTLNVGLISGGAAANIVPERCVLSGEIRSMRHDRALALYDALCEVFREEAQAVGACARVDCDVPLRAYRAAENGDAVRRFQRACAAERLPVRLIETFGGSDNAALQAHGIDSIVAANAMFSCHSTDEYTTVEDLKKTALLVARLITDEI